MQAMMATALNDMVSDGKLQKHALITVSKVKQIMIRSLISLWNHLMLLNSLECFEFGANFLQLVCCQSSEWKKVNIFNRGRIDQSIGS